jgi:hypothetical protein
MPLFASNVPNLTASTLFSSTATVTVAATTVETSIIGSGSGSLTLPANYLTAGKTIRFSLRGLYSTPTLSVGNILVKIKLGGSTLASGTANALVATSTNLGFSGEGIITCRTTGASGSVIMMGGLEYGVGNNLAPLFLAINNGTSTTTVDTTSALAFDCTVTWSNNTVGNSVSSLNATLEGLN